MIELLCEGTTLITSFVIKYIAVSAMILTMFNPINNPISMLLTIMVEMPGIEPGSNHKRHVSKSTVYKFVKRLIWFVSVNRSLFTSLRPNVIGVYRLFIKQVRMLNYQLARKLDR